MENTQISNFKKIRPVGAEAFHADGQTDMTKLVVTFRNFSKAPKMTICIHTYTHTHTYIHTYIHTHIHAHTHTYIPTSFPCKLNTFRKRVKNVVTSKGIQVGTECK